MPGAVPPTHSPTPPPRSPLPHPPQALKVAKTFYLYGHGNEHTTPLVITLKVGVVLSSPHTLWSVPLISLVLYPPSPLPP